MTECRLSRTMMVTVHYVGQHTCECGFVLDLREWTRGALLVVDGGERKFRGRMPYHTLPERT